MRKLLKGLPDRIVRLLAEMRVEILWHNTPDNKNPFVSLQRRELKYTIRNELNDEKCSSLCGDVSCNTESAFKEYLKEGVRSLAET